MRPESAQPTSLLIALSVDDLSSRIVGLAGRLAAATCRWLLLVAEFDAREGCAQFGLSSTSRWLSHYCGASRRTAIEHVRVARSLAAFPALARAMSSGRLSYSHVRAISRLARDGETRLVDDLIELAENSSVRQLESTVRGLRTVDDYESDGIEKPAEYLGHSWADDSQLHTQIRLDPEHGALVQSTLAAIARAEGITAPEAMVRMAEIAAAALNDAERPPRRLRGDERAAIVVHLNADVDGQARIADGPGLPPRVVRRLLCSGRIRTVLGDRRGNVLDLGRSHRVVSDKQFRALLQRARCCTHPGCDSVAGLEAHHVLHWINGGRTDMNNLVLLCERHHHAHHEGEFTIVRRRGGTFQFGRPDGTPLPMHVDPSSFIDTDVRLEDDHALVPATSPEAATTRWTGARLDHAWAVSVLAERRLKAVAS